MFSDKYDLVVVGAGIAGLATAYFYKECFPDHTVLVLERKGPGRSKGLGGVGGGLTGRSGGHRMPGFEADHSEVVKLIGEQAALQLYQETLRISEITDQIIERERIDCGSRRGYWIVDEHPREFSKLDEFMKPRNALGLQQPQFFEGAELKKHIDFAGYNAGLHFPDIATFDTPKFIYGLAEALQRRGVVIAEGYEYREHKPAKNGTEIRLAGGQVLQAKRLVLAGGDILSRKIPFLHKRTATVYTGRIGVKLRSDDFARLSPSRKPLAGCDSDLKSNQNPLEGDFLWFSLRSDGYLAMGFGGCFGSISPNATRSTIDKMVEDVRRELYERIPLLKDGNYRIKPSVGGLNTSSNLLPILGHIDHQEHVYAIAAQSGVGLNQSMLLAKALVDKFAGDTRIYDMVAKFEHGQVIIPTPAILRRAAIEVGVLEKASSLAPVRLACRTAHGIAGLYTRARTPFERSEP